MKLTKMKLGDLCTFKYGQMPRKDELVDKGFPVFSGYRIVGYATKYHYAEPEIIIVARGVGGTGDVKMSPPRCFLTNLSIAALLKADAGVDKTFLYYLLSSTKLWALRTGTAQAQITIERLQVHEVELPPLEVQRKIVSIVGPYDNLIENNSRRIEVLEQMAQMVYREWFVNFHFPGHEKVKMVESEMGRIPDCWQVSRLGDLTTKIGSGATPRGGKKSYQTTGISLIRSLNVYDYRFEMLDLAFIDNGQARQLDNVTVEPHDVLLNITGASVGRCAMVPSHLLPARVNQHVAIVRANPAKSDPFFLLDTINHDPNKQRLLSIAQGGATREALTKETITEFPTLLPSLDLIRRYGQIAGPFHKQRENLSRKNEVLRKTRDLFLAKLVSGKLTVEQIERKAIAQMA